MIRVAMLGSDSTHTEAFASRINKPGAPFESFATVAALWGEDREQAERKAVDLGIPQVAGSVDEALDGADLAMVIGRFGESHYEPACRAIDRNVPTFVDKPFTTDYDQAEELAARARDRDVPLTSTSPLRFAAEVRGLKGRLAADPAAWNTVVVTAPASCTDLGLDPRLNSPFFYGIHGMEILLELVGHDLAAAETVCGASMVTCHLELSDGRRSGVLHLVRGMDEAYIVDVHGAQPSEHAVVSLDGSYYTGQLDYLLNGFLEGKDRVPLDSTLEAIRILHRIEREDRRGRQS